MQEQIIQIRDYIYRLTDESAVLKSWNKARATVELPNFVEGLPVRDIEPEAFRGCTALRDLSLPVEMQHLPLPELKHCRSLEAIRVSPLHPEYSSEDGILYNKDKTELLDCPPARKKPVIVPETVVKIGKSAFKGCEELTEIQLPEGLGYIGEDAFMRCKKLRRLDLPENVYWIAPHALTLCTQLRSLHFSAHIEKAPLLWGCKSLRTVTVSPENPALSSVEGVLYTADRKNLIYCPNAYTGTLHLPAETVQITYDAFAGCDGLGQISVSADNTVYSDRSGVLCDKEGRTLLLCPAAYAGTLRLDADVQRIEPDAFRLQVLPAVLREHGITKYTWIEGSPLTCIEADRKNPAFQTENGVLYSADGKTLLRCPAGYTGRLTVRESVCAVADAALRGCSELTEITLPPHLQTVGNAAFAGCFSLDTVTLPASVTSAGREVFSGCVHLRHVFFENPDTVIGAESFWGCGSVILHAAPGGAVQEYAKQHELRFVAAE